MGHRTFVQREWATKEKRLRTTGLPHLDWGIPLSVFLHGTTSELDGFLHTIPLMLNV